VSRVRQTPRLGGLPVVILAAKKEDRKDVEILGRQGNIVLLKASPGVGLLQKIAELLEQFAKV
jgi:hypothetical protein